MNGLLQNPLFGLASGLLGGTAPGGTFGGGLNLGLQNMMQQQRTNAATGLMGQQVAQLQQMRQLREAQEQRAAQTAQAQAEQRAWQQQYIQSLPQAQQLQAQVQGPQAFLEYQQKQGELAASQAGASAKAIADQMPDLGDINTLRDDVKAELLPIREAASAGAQLDALLSKPGPITDLAATVQFAKVLDPRSVVRESEIGMQAAAAGPWERVQSSLRKAQGEGSLTPALRADMRRALGELMTVYEKEGKSAINYWTEEAGRSKVAPERILGRPLNFPDLTPAGVTPRPAWATPENEVRE